MYFHAATKQFVLQTIVPDYTAQLQPRPEEKMKQDEVFVGQRVQHVHLKFSGSVVGMFPELGEPFPIHAQVRLDDGNVILTVPLNQLVSLPGASVLQDPSPQTDQSSEQSPDQGPPIPGAL